MGFINHYTPALVHVNQIAWHLVGEEQAKAWSHHAAPTVETRADQMEYRKKPTKPKPYKTMIYYEVDLG